MEETLNHQNGPQLGPQTITNNKQAEEQDPKAQYSIPGILHFIQHEWARFELERSQWEVDKAELQARIAFLQGERKGQENLKNDLVRRIKMLEYALKQERAKFHKLKYGVELNQGDMKPPVMEDGSLMVDSQLDADTPYTSVSNATWRQSRQLLRQYLQEIGYTDRIIDVRSTRVKALLGLNNNGGDNDENINRGPINGNESNKRANESYGRRTPAKKVQPGSLPEAMMLDTEAAVIANLDFLGNTDVDMDDDDDDDMNDDLVVSMDMMEKSGKSTSATAQAMGDISADDSKQQQVGQKSSSGGGTLISDVDREAIEMLNELNMISETENQKSKNTEEWVKTARPTITSTVDTVESTLGLGELAQLTVNNEAENSYDLNSSGKEAYRKTWNAKYTLRSHFDGVRTLAFHPTEPILVTGSEDHTVKLWNLQKTVPAKKSTSLDVEPLYTFRSHQGSVLCLAMGQGGTDCYSGGLDGHIHRWSLRHLEVIDPYEPYDPSVVLQTLTGHTDAVWRLASCHQYGTGSTGGGGTGEYLASCSADGSVKLWLPANITPLMKSYSSEADGTPTSVDFVRDEVNRIAVSYSSSHSVIFDTETGRPIIRLESDSSSTADRQINCLVCHPTLSLTITAHADRHIRFWDNNSGKIVHSMVAHLDEVTSLAVDPNGLYLLSGSHDCSIRIWHLDNKTCVQEITAHRKKFDESILDVAFHPTRPFIASAGADGLAKVFV